MKLYRNLERTTVENCGVKADEYIGESLEEKVRRVTETNQPIEAISPMIYTERKDGVLPAYDIRADKWDIAQSAMNTICNANRERREKKQTVKPDANSEVNAQNKSKLGDGTQLA